MKRRNKLLFVCLAILLVACGEQPFYQQTFSFDNREWPQEVKPKYEVEINDTEKEYNFTLTLRTSTDYKYSNLWIFMKTETPDGTIAREPFEISIANPDGSWTGEKSGSVVTNSLVFKRRKMPQKGVYTFTLEQGITASKIDEVHDLIFTVDEVPEDH